MQKNIVIITTISLLTCSLFASKSVRVDAHEDFLIGNGTDISAEAAYGQLQLKTEAGAVDSFDFAPKSIWSGSYVLYSSGLILLSGINEQSISSEFFDWTKDITVITRVLLPEQAYKAGGIFLAGTTPATGIWISRSAANGVVSVSSTSASSPGLNNGVYLKIEKVGSLVQFFFRQDIGYGWKNLGGSNISGTNFALVLKSFPVGDSNVGAYFTNLEVTPYRSVGLWTSASYDLTTTPTTVGTIKWSQNLPAGTKIEIQTSTSDDNISWSNWSPAYSDYRGSIISSPAGRYIRVAATLYANATRQDSPILDSIQIEYPDAQPNAPLLTPLSHAVSGWSTPTAVSLLWAMPTGNPAPESTYTYWLRLNGALTATASAAILEAAGQNHFLGLPLPAEGSYSLDLQVRGDATSGGLTSSAQTYSFGYDATPPGPTTISSATHPELLFVNNRNPVFHLDASDALSGVSGYATVLDKVPGGDPGTVVNSGADLRVASLDNGTWYLHARAVDKAGNAGPVSHYGIRVDYSGELLSRDYVKALPNPVRSDTALLQYELAAPATEVTLEFRNSQGEIIRSQDGTRTVGANQVRWDVSNLANGVYFFRVNARSAEDGRRYSVVRKVAVLR